MRSTLAHRVAKKLKQYLDSMVSSGRGGIARLGLFITKPQRSHTMDESTPEQWKIGEGFMKLDNLFLVRLESVTNGSWQPEICVVDPTV